MGITSALPASGHESDNAFVPEGYIPPKGAGLNLAWPAQVIGDYFTPQEFLSSVDASSLRPTKQTLRSVAIVNRTLAERYWPGQDPIGKRLKIGVPESPTPWMTIVGEMGDIKQTSADSEVKNQIFTPSSQFKATLGQFAPPDMLNGTYGTIVVRGQIRAGTDGQALRATVRSIDPQLPLTHSRIHGPGSGGRASLTPFQYDAHFRLRRLGGALVDFGNLQRDRVFGHDANS